MGGTKPRDERSAMACSVSSPVEFSSTEAAFRAEATKESTEMMTETTQSLHASFSIRVGSYNAQDSQSMIMGRRLDLTTDMTSTHSSPSLPQGPKIPPEVEVIATLLIDPLGRVSEGGTSRGLSSALDRERFLSFRRWGRCILIGGQTFQVESYQGSRLPVEVFSRSKREITSWSAELERLKRKYGKRILVEAGPGLLHQLLDDDLIDRLYLTRSDRESSDSHSPIFDINMLTKSGTMECIESFRREKDIFETYQSLRLA